MDISKMLQVAGALLFNLTSLSYIKKFFSSPEKNKTSYLLDTTGRIKVYHGVNVSNYSKTAPDYLPWQTKEDFARLNAWGFNLVRYLVFWQAIEPIEGHYNLIYIESTIERLKWLQELNIDVIIDVHQDIYTTKFTGDGFPGWTVHDNGLPFKQQSPWNMNYFEPAVLSSYNYFWKNDDLKTKYVGMLKYLLTNVDNLSNVIGIDVMNEPFFGTIPHFEKTILTDFYSKIQDMIQENDFKTEIIFEPEMYTSAGIPSDLKFTPRRNTLQVINNSTSVYAPHYYDAFIHEGASYKPFNRFLMKRAMAIKQAEAQKYNVPLLIGEFGISPSVKGHVQYLQDFVQLANENLIGWTYYAFDKKNEEDFGLINDDGTPSDLLGAIQCVYPQKIAGINPRITLDEKRFILDYETDPSIKGPTEIFIPSLNNLKVIVNYGDFPAVPNQVFKYENDPHKTQHIDISWV
jgi:endoglycosylceramidase